MGSVPPGTFRGVNFITPEVLERGSVGDGSYWELSKGTGLSGEPLYGLTFRKPQDERLDPDPSTCFHSLSEAQAFLEEHKQGRKPG